MYMLLHPRIHVCACTNITQNVTSTQHQVSMIYETTSVTLSVTSLPLTAGNMENMEKYDLTPTLCQYLDRHLVFPLLEFLSVKEVSTCHEIKSNFGIDALSLTVLKIATKPCGSTNALCAHNIRPGKFSSYIYSLFSYQCIVDNRYTSIIKELFDTLRWIVCEADLRLRDSLL